MRAAISGVWARAGAIWAVWGSTMRAAISGVWARAGAIWAVWGSTRRAATSAVECEQGSALNGYRLGALAGEKIVDEFAQSHPSFNYYLGYTFT